MTDLKHWKVELLDTRTEKVISGFCVSAKTWADARLVAHALPEIAEDKDMKLMVYSVEDADSGEKHVFYERMKNADTSFTILM